MGAGREECRLLFLAGDVLDLPGQGDDEHAAEGGVAVVGYPDPSGVVVIRHEAFEAATPFVVPGEAGAIDAQVATDGELRRGDREVAAFHAEHELVVVGGALVIALVVPGFVVRIVLVLLLDAVERRREVAVERHGLGLAAVRHEGDVDGDRDPGGVLGVPVDGEVVRRHLVAADRQRVAVGGHFDPVATRRSDLFAVETDEAGLGFTEQGHIHREAGHLARIVGVGVRAGVGVVGVGVAARAAHQRQGREGPDDVAEHGSSSGCDRSHLVTGLELNT